MQNKKERHTEGQKLERDETETQKKEIDTHRESGKRRE